MNIYFFVLILFLLGCTHSAIEPNTPLKLHPYSTDGCSVYLDGVPLISPDKWVHCCLMHDVNYWMGGVAEERKKSDTELGECVGEASFSLHGWMMKTGTRMGGFPNETFPWRWGYGWNTNRDYKELKKENKKEVLNHFANIIEIIKSKNYELNEKQWNYIERQSEIIRDELERVSSETTSSIDDFFNPL